MPLVLVVAVAAAAAAAVACSSLRRRVSAIFAAISAMLTGSASEVNDEEGGVLLEGDGVAAFFNLL